MKMIITILLLRTLVLASKKIYNFKDTYKANSTFYDRNTKKLIDGVIKSYYPSGKVEQTLPCTQGMPNGASTLYDETGKVISITHYKDGIEVLKH